MTSPAMTLQVRDRDKVMEPHRRDSVLYANLESDWRSA